MSDTLRTARKNQGLGLESPGTQPTQLPAPAGPTTVDESPPNRSSFELIESRQGSFSDSRPGSLSDYGPDDLVRMCPVCSLRYPATFNVCPKDAATLIDAPQSDDELIGTTLSQTYTLIRLVGEGGMGRVYEARHTRLGSKRFAIKLLHPEYARHSEVLSRFQREAEAAAAIRSRHVGDVYDVHKTADGRPYIVAEFLEGTELAARLLTYGRVTVPYAVYIGRQICRALAAAHDAGIVHRDMKPENVFLTGDIERPIAKVIDFGISKFGDAGGSSLTKTGMIMGTPSYMAPEQARGERVDHRADIYAVGAILYHMLTGKRPFDRNDPTATITAVLLEEPERPCAISPDIPAGLELVIQRAMAKGAADRYGSVRDLDAALAPFDTLGRNTPNAVVPMGASLPAPALTPSHQSAVDVGMRAHFSRPVIALMSGLVGFAVVTGVATVVGAFIRWIRGSDAASNVTGTEALILVFLIPLALATPAFFAIKHMRATVWNNTAKAVATSKSLTRIVATGYGVYGFGWLAIRFLETVVIRRAAGAAWPFWDLLVTALAAVAVGLVELSVKRDRR